MNQLKDSERDTRPIQFEVNGKDEHSQTKVSEDFFNDNEHVGIHSWRNGDSNETKDESLQSSKKRESRHSSSVQITISDLFEADEDMYTNKKNLECEVPKLTAWYKETNDGHIVKDVCVDEVVNVKVGTLTEASEEESLVEKKFPVEEFGTRSFLTSFISSFEHQGYKPLQPVDQGISEDEVSDSPTLLSAEADCKGENLPANILYDSKIENGSITFDFKYPAPVESRITNGRKKNKEQLESRNFLDNTNVLADDISDTRSISLVQFSSVTDNSTRDVRGRAINIKDAASDNISKPSLVQGPSYNDTRTEISDRETLTHEHGSSNDLSVQTVDPHAIKNDHGNSDDVSFAGRVQYDDGESSFSAAGLDTFSGRIAHSGNLSLRSDSSATSGRSFAFPILQSEWNSSPVRMAKGNRRHFRKHKDWRSGLLCCRF